MQLSPYVKGLLQKRCGREMNIPADCEFLALDIESRTKVRVGATTLKHPQLPSAEIEAEANREAQALIGTTFNRMRQNAEP